MMALQRPADEWTLSSINPLSAVIRLLFFTFLWWVLTQGDFYTWWFGLIMIVIATVVSLAIQPPTRWRAIGLIRFIPFFIRQSILGGIDVARRALSPAMPLDPGMVEFPLRATDPTSRVVIAATMSLLPGTVSVELRDATIRLHVLDRAMPVEQTLRQLEERAIGLVTQPVPVSS
jgi:multicomponent Na+:H+ antiporter subunit E